MRHAPIKVLCDLSYKSSYAACILRRRSRLPRLVAAGAGVSVVGRVRASPVPACRAQHHPLCLGGDEEPRRNLGAFVSVSQALPALAVFAHVSSFPTAV